MAVIVSGVTFRFITARMLRTCLSLLVVFLCKNLCSQDFSYTRYDIKDGLAGSHVFCGVQDKEGFLWFGTESGLSRFDGVHFKTFTTEDGLPDNEIINLYCDSKGRVWLIPFRKSICYYYKGKLHTQQNDSLLNKFRIKGNIYYVAEDKHGTIAFAESYRIHLLKGGTISTIDTAILNTSKPREFYITALAPDDSGMIQVHTKAGLFKIAENRLVPTYIKEVHSNMGEVLVGRNFFVDVKPIEIFKINPANKFIITFFRKRVQRIIGTTSGHINFSLISDSLFSNNTNDGAIIYNSNDPGFMVHHLAGKSVSFVFQDAEKNTWFCTQREGVYKLNSPFVSGHQFKGINNKPLSVYAIYWHKDNLWVGTEDSYLFTFRPSTGVSRLQPHTKDIIGSTRNSVRVLFETNTRDLIIGLQKQLKTVSGLAGTQTGSLKDLTAGYDNTALASTSFAVWVLNTVSLKSVDTIWRGRATTAHYSNHDQHFYVGTLEGLYIISKQKKIHFAGDDTSLFKSRIAAIRETPDGTMWIATYDRGIIKYKNNKVIDHITKEHGLSSNISRCLFLRGNNLWIGTDRGLDKITFGENDYTLTKYSVADGLVSDFINCVYADDSLVYVGTPEGISYFDHHKISQKAPCLLHLTDIIVSGKSIVNNSSFTLPRKQNNIRFEYSGISYRSGGDITYRYRLSGLDTGWRITRESFLNYPILSPGDYAMELQAINKFGVKSDIIRIPFSIEKFWWEKLGIRIAAIIAFLLLVGFITNRRIKQVRLREKEKNLLREQISSIEQMALRAQMNPHFIFNSLNSIQHYVLDKDIVGANKYIAGFSRLIRLTLDNSSKSEISIEEEVNYLSQYLELEKMRQDDKFSYSITVAPDILQNGYTISPMLLQPFVENSIRHGIRYRSDSDGHIKIDITGYEKGLRFIIEDNGVGRAVASAYKSRNPIEYQSKGIALTEQRINLINKNNKERIDLTITDIEKDGVVAGTRVVMNYPESINQQL